MATRVNNIPIIQEPSEVPILQQVSEDTQIPTLNEVEDTPVEFIALNEPTGSNEESTINYLQEKVKNLKDDLVQTTSSWLNMTNLFVIIGLIIVGVLAYLYYDLYTTYGFNGMLKQCQKSFTDIKKWCTGEYDFDSGMPMYMEQNIMDTTDTHVEQVAEVEQSSEEPTQEICDPEVYNVDENVYTYEEAPIVCEALGGKLATYNQVREAHQKGAHWCNYGWSDEQMALFPIQEEKWKEQEKCGDKPCGTPGVNGGYFEDTSLRFGVNCYGPKPKPEEGRIVYDSEPNKDELLQKIKDQARDGDLLVRPFNNSRWSTYSFKKSSYIIDTDENLQHTVEENLSEHDKDPHSVSKNMLMQDELQ